MLEMTIFNITGLIEFFFLNKKGRGRAPKILSEILLQQLG